MGVIEYVTEEVSRQGHDVKSLDGIERVGWMLDGWSYAIENADDGKPTIEDAIQLGKFVELRKNLYGIRTCAVQVGSRLCPPAEYLMGQLEALWDGGPDKMSPLDFYKAFEEIHPFVDGNGRVGKILLNWLNGTLLDPIFPPNNLWGREIRNP